MPKLYLADLLMNSFFLAIAVAGATRASELEQLESLIHEIEGRQEEAYGSIHAVYSVEFDVEGQKNSTEVEYWSREKKYFRIDERSPEDGSVLSRLIVRPEGFVRMNKGAEGQLAIIDYGTGQQGLSYLYSYTFFRAGETLGRGPKIGVVLDDMMRQDEVPLWRLVSAEGFEDARLNLVFDLKGHAWNVTVDNEKYLIAQIKTASSITTREFDTDGVLQTSSSNSTVAGSNSYSEKVTLLKLSHEDIPIGVFSLEAQGERYSPWPRRLLMIAIAALVASIYSVYRYRKNRA